MSEVFWNNLDIDYKSLEIDEIVEYKKFIFPDDIKELLSESGYDKSQSLNGTKTVTRSPLLNRKKGITLNHEVGHYAGIKPTSYYDDKALIDQGKEVNINLSQPDYNLRLKLFQKRYR